MIVVILSFLFHITYVVFEFLASFGGIYLSFISIILKFAGKNE